MFICKFCSKECKNSNSLRNHERLCKFNPARQSLPAKTKSWYDSMHSRKGQATNQYRVLVKAIEALCISTLLKTPIRSYS